MSQVIPLAMQPKTRASELPVLREELRKHLGSRA